MVLSVPEVLNFVPQELQKFWRRNERGRNLRYRNIVAKIVECSEFQNHASRIINLHPGIRTARLFPVTPDANSEKNSGIDEPKISEDQPGVEVTMLPHDITLALLSHFLTYGPTIFSEIRLDDLVNLSPKNLRSPSPGVAVPPSPIKIALYGCPAEQGGDPSRRFDTHNRRPKAIAWYRSAPEAKEAAKLFSGESFAANEARLTCFQRGQLRDS